MGHHLVLANNGIWWDMMGYGYGIWKWVGYGPCMTIVRWEHQPVDCWESYFQTRPIRMEIVYEFDDILFYSPLLTHTIFIYHPIFKYSLVNCPMTNWNISMLWGFINELSNFLWTGYPHIFPWFSHKFPYKTSISSGYVLYFYGHFPVRFLYVYQGGSLS